MKKYILRYVICFFVTFGIAGCAREQFPNAKIEPVKKYSLGTAKFTPFKKRPTAEELYKTTLRLYDSFNTIATTIDLTWKLVHEWDEVDGKAENIKVYTGRITNEIRSIKPDKLLSIGSGDDNSVEVKNGKVNYYYYTFEHCYKMLDTGSNIHRHAANLAFLLPLKGTSVKLLPDRKINGTDVYVLELKPKKSQRFYRRVYIGKMDLLPRRTVLIEQPKNNKFVWPKQGPSHKKVRGVPNSIRTYEFIGFVANSKLSNDLFPKHPPKGTRRISKSAIMLYR